MMGWNMGWQVLPGWAGGAGSSAVLQRRLARAGPVMISGLGLTFVRNWGRCCSSTVLARAARSIFVFRWPKIFSAHVLHLCFIICSFVEIIYSTSWEGSAEGSPASHQEVVAGDFFFGFPQEVISGVFFSGSV